MQRRRCFYCLVAAGLLLLGAQAAQGEEGLLDSFEKRVSEFSLDNGMTFLVVNQPEVPAVSFVTMVKVGSVDEPSGKTGLAHLFEHMVFKGTKEIGTTDWAREKELLERMEALQQEISRLERSSEAGQDELEKLTAQFEELQGRAKRLIKPNEFSKIIERNGGSDLNAGTSTDYTMYQCRFPANRAELWFSLESDRLRNPVWREFYTEREVVLEERRLRVESNPSGRLLERLVAMSYLAHPYRRPVIGWGSDIQSLTRKDLQTFYERYYVPNNMVVVIVGDVRVEQVKEWARTYFGTLTPNSALHRRVTDEPQQRGRRELTIEEDNPPIYVRAFHTVAFNHPDTPALELLGDVLATGRTSLLHTRLVLEKRLAARVFALNGYPGQRYPALFIIYAVPNQDASMTALAESLAAELSKVRAGEISQEALRRAQTKVRADLIRSLDSDLGLARSLAKAEILQGDWRRHFTYLKEIEAVTIEDLQRVARTYLQEELSTVGQLISKPDSKKTQ